MLENIQRKILYIENDRHWRKLLSSIFEREGFEIVGTFSLHGARSELEHMTPLPVLAIVDLDLPHCGIENDTNLDGLDLLHILQKKEIYAIILSAHTEKKAVETCLNSPVLRSVVNKWQFVHQEGFETEFVNLVKKVIGIAEADRQAEGKMPDQRVRLRHLQR